MSTSLIKVVEYEYREGVYMRVGKGRNLTLRTSAYGRSEIDELNQRAVTYALAELPKLSFCYLLVLPYQATRHTLQPSTTLLLLHYSAIMPVSSSVDADNTTTRKSASRTTPRNSKDKQPHPRALQSLASPTTDTHTEQLPMSPISQPLTAQQPQQSQSQTKKIARRSSKPIIDWFQRKLAGTVRPRRASESIRGRNHGGTNVSGRDKRRPPLPDNFRELTRVQSTPSRGRGSSDHDVRRSAHTDDVSSRPAPISLNGDEPESIVDAEAHGDFSTYRSSLARESMWSPTSNLEADEDASVRPIPPSSPPSPSPSRSSASYLSDPRTFKSMAASTKPTTLLSVDLTNGMAHIAQAPPTPATSPAPRIPSHVRSSSGVGGSTGGSITFSALPPSPSSSVHNSLNFNAQTAGHHNVLTHALQAPQHTTHHPRNNPHPSSPPPDNASVLTLASSAFAFPGARIGVVGGTTDTVSLSHLSHFGGSRFGAEDRSSHFVLGDEFDAEGEVDASVRALRPRSSRRGSWESEVSGWSARLGNGSVVGIGPGTPSMLGGRSLWSASLKTGGRFRGNDDDDSVDDSDEAESEGEEEHQGPVQNGGEGKCEEKTGDGTDVQKRGGFPSTSEQSKSSAPSESQSVPSSNGILSDTTSSAESPIPTILLKTDSTDVISIEGDKRISAQDHDSSSRDRQIDADVVKTGSRAASLDEENERLQAQEVAEDTLSDVHTEVWHSAPSTPMF
ncbi:hypothetical protein EW146_g3228 [Bondarzewia mesenterica]|uniref:Uncharacterized protein n=1 Tax=Bondarzewia mesenterica TaxID=1095465 RepID=A0A4S4M012_9AGAM|nr:hypothetical protein EW146_g3228 [Bondarzewia mesenterica]